MSGVQFANPPPTLTAAQIVANVAIMEPTEGWTRADDVRLMEGVFMGLKLGEIGARMGKTLPQMTARWLELRTAATGGGIVFTLTAQERLLVAVRGLSDG